MNPFGKLFLIIALLGPDWACALPLLRMPMPEQATELAPPADQAYRHALDALVRDDLKDAQAQFEAALRLDKHHVNAMLGLAEIAFRTRQIEQAGRWLGQAAQIAPGNAWVLASQGRFHAMKGRPQQAEAAWRKARQIDPGAFSPRIDLADLLASRGDLKEAIALYGEALRLRPDHAGAHHGLGVAWAKVPDFAKAETSLRRSAELDPNNPLPPLALARLYSANERADAALAQTDLALRLQPGLVDALVLRGDLYLATNKQDKALESFQKAASLNPKNAALRLKTALAQHSLGQKRPAISSYKQAIALDSKLALAYNNLASLTLVDPAARKDALKWAERAVGLAPKAADFLDTLAWAQRANNQLPAALQSMQKALALAPTNPEFLYRLAVLQSESGKTTAARDSLKKALAKGPFPSRDAAEKLLARLPG